VRNGAAMFAGRGRRLAASGIAVAFRPDAHLTPPAFLSAAELGTPDDNGDSICRRRGGQGLRDSRFIAIVARWTQSSRGVRAFVSRYTEGDGSAPRPSAN
jgi:hypothetical protein